MGKRRVVARVLTVVAVLAAFLAVIPAAQADDVCTPFPDGLTVTVAGQEIHIPPIPQQCFSDNPTDYYWIFEIVTQAEDGSYYIHLYKLTHNETPQGTCLLGTRPPVIGPECLVWLYM